MSHPPQQPLDPTEGVTPEPVGGPHRDPHNLTPDDEFHDGSHRVDEELYPEDERHTAAPDSRRLLAIIAAVLAALLLIGLLIWHPWSSKDTKESTAPTPDVVASPPQASPTTSTQAQILAHPSKMFKAGNVYSQDISKAPMESNSAAMTQHLVKQVTSLYNGNATLNAFQYHGTLYQAGPQTKKVTVRFQCQDKKKTALPGFMAGPKVFMNVPMPGNAVAANGTDGHVAIWSPTEDKLWEFWAAKKDAKGVWSACYGGRIDKVSQSMGQFPYPYGTSASGLAVPGSMVSIEEAKALKIEHAIGLNIPEPANWPKLSYPANRTDGWSNNPNALPEGSRLRLDPSVDVDSLEMTPLAKAIAHAAQKYGFIVTDKSGAVAVVAEGGERRVYNAKGAKVAANPWGKILAGKDASEVLKGFPWDKMQVIKTDWGTPKGYVDPHTKASGK